MNRSPIGTLNLEKIQDTIYDWIKEVMLGVLGTQEDDTIGQIIWRNQGQPLPARPCVTLKFIDGPRPIARNGNAALNSTTHATVVGIQMEATLSIQVFGNTQMHEPLAGQLATDINSSLLRQTVLDDLKRGGVSIQGVGSPKNISALEESRYEERYGFEIDLGLVQNVIDDPGVIENINLTKTVDGNTVEQNIELS